MKPCLECGRPSRGTRCPEHAIAYGYGSAHWQQIRAARLQLDGHRCTLRHHGCTELATTVHLDPSCCGDHSIATIANTTSACLHCHGVEDGPRSIRQNHRVDAVATQPNPEQSLVTSERVAPMMSQSDVRPDMRPLIG